MRVLDEAGFLSGWSLMEIQFVLWGWHCFVRSLVLGSQLGDHFLVELLQLDVKVLIFTLKGFHMESLTHPVAWSRIGADEIFQSSTYLFLFARLGFLSQLELDLILLWRSLFPSHLKVAHICWRFRAIIFRLFSVARRDLDADFCSVNIGINHGRFTNHAFPFIYDIRQMWILVLLPLRDDLLHHIRLMQTGTQRHPLGHLIHLNPVKL